MTVLNFNNVIHKINYLYLNTFNMHINKASIKFTLISSHHITHETFSKEKARIFTISSKDHNSLIPFSLYIKNYIDSKKNILSPHVYYNYTKFCLSIIDKYFTPKGIFLQNITSSELNSFFSFLTKKGYKPSTLMQIAKVIRPAMKLAYDSHIIRSNPFINVNQIPKSWNNISFYNKNQLKKLLYYIHGNQLELPLKFAIFYGLRRSELLGLRWSSIDFTHNYITINHKVIYVNGKFICSNKLKTPKSYRTLPLIPELKQNLLSLKKLKNENMDKIGNNYNHNFDEYVFTDNFGNLIHPNRLDYTLSTIIKKNKLPHIRLHDLRHSCASLLLSQGVQLKEIQEWLGHSSYSTTANIYSHIDLHTKASTARSMSSALNLTPTSSSEERHLFTKLALCYDQIRKYGYSSLDEFYKYMIKITEMA